jgi:segregation and condensation protein B
MTEQSSPDTNGDTRDGSLADRLTNAFAEMLGDTPASGANQHGGDTDKSPDAGDVLPLDSDIEGMTPTGNVTPEGVVEAMLFVGSPENEPLLPAQLTAVVPGLTAEDIEQIVRDLNERYRRRESPYEIVSLRAGYRLVLRDEFESVSRRVLGRTRSTRLSRAAVDVLSLVAYMQPISSEDVGGQRGHPSQAILRQLVRRQLLEIERDPQNRRHIYYRTTERFLKLFNLTTIEDLPRVPDLDPSAE